MLIKEYRIILPFSVEEYKRGQLYAVSETSKNETGGGEGVELVKQVPFTSSELRPGQTLKGIHTRKIYRVKSKVPFVFRKMLPAAASVIQEDSWNAYPYTKTILTNPDYMKENFQVCVESFHAPDRGEQQNVLGLSKEALKKREIVFLDIADGSHLKKNDHNSNNNVGEFKSQKTGRGPLNIGWSKNQNPIMCAYKLVSVEFKWFGVQARLEKTIHQSYPRMFVKFNRETFCWMDKWYDLTLNDIRKIESETATNLKKQINEGSLKGIAGADDNTSMSTSGRSQSRERD